MTEREGLEKEFRKLFKEKKRLNSEMNSLEKKIENPKTYTTELYNKHTEVLKERFKLDKKIETNVEKRRKKGFIKVEL